MKRCVSEGDKAHIPRDKGEAECDLHRYPLTSSAPQTPAPRPSICAPLVPGRLLLPPAAKKETNMLTWTLQKYFTKILHYINI